MNGPTPGGGTCPSWLAPTSRLLKRYESVTLALIIVADIIGYALVGSVFLAPIGAPVLAVSVALTLIMEDCDSVEALKSAAKQAEIGCNVLAIACGVAAFGLTVGIITAPAGVGIGGIAAVFVALGGIFHALSLGRSPELRDFGGLLVAAVDVGAADAVDDPAAKAALKDSAQYFRDNPTKIPKAARKLMATTSTTLSEKDAAAWSALVGTSLAAADLGGDRLSVVALAKQQLDAYGSPVRPYLGGAPPGFENTLASSAAGGDRSAQKFFRAPPSSPKVIMVLAKVAKALVPFGAADVTPQQVSDAWRVAFGDRFTEEELTSFGLLARDPASRVRVAGGGSNFLRNLLIGGGAVGGVAIVVTALKKKRKA